MQKNEFIKELAKLSKEDIKNFIESKGKQPKLIKILIHNK